MNWPPFNLQCDCQTWTNFPRVEFQGKYSGSERERKFSPRLFISSIIPEIWHFYVVVVQFLLYRCRRILRSLPSNAEVVKQRSVWGEGRSVEWPQRVRLRRRLVKRWVNLNSSRILQTGTWQKLRVTSLLASHAGDFRGARISSLVGRDEIRAPLNTPAWEATTLCAFDYFYRKCAI